jgi:putative acetyltransferase
MLELINESNSYIFDELAQDYEDEFSPTSGKKKNQDGKYPIDVDWHTPNVGYYWKEGSKVVGFSIVESIDGYFEIVDFYVIPAYRKKMIGKNMAFAVFNQHPGPWRVRQISGSESATKFWRRVIGEHTNENFTESKIENPPWGLSVCQIFNHQISQFHKESYHETERDKSTRKEISVRDYHPDDVQALANIYFNTIHKINIQHYTEEQVNVWAPTSSLETEGWAKKFPRTKPIIATVGDQIVGFAEFEPNGHIDCFYCHHEWIGKGVGSSLIKEILQRAKTCHIHLIFAEVSITAKPFFEKWGFKVVTEQTIVRKGVELTNFKMERTV